MTGCWLLYKRIKDVLLFFCLVVEVNGNHQALTLHFLYMNKCQPHFVEPFLRLKYRIYSKGPKLIRNYKGVVGHVI